MKKLLVITASILAASAGSAYAQVAPATEQTSTIEQIGNGNLANVDQTLSQEGVSDIYQEGDNNQALVTHIEDAIGNDTFGEPGNVSEIDQIGSDQFASITSSNEVTPFTLDRNTSTIRQDEDGSGALTVAGGLRTGGFTLEAVSVQSGYGNTGLIDQSGSGNFADTEQRGTFNDSMITQVDVSNTAIVRQGVDVVADPGDFNVSVVDQSGNGQFAMVTQLSLIHI